MSQIVVPRVLLSQSVPIESSFFSYNNPEIRQVEEEEIEDPAIVIEDINSLWPNSRSGAVPKSPRSPTQEVTFEQCYSISERHSCIGQAFQKFLKKRQNEESLHFLQDVMSFENQFSQLSTTNSTEQIQGNQGIDYNNKDIAEEAKRITSLFIEPNSKHELNLSCEAKQAFLEQFSTLLAEKSITCTIFKTVKEIILVQLKEECYEAFLQSEDCKDALETLKFINQQQLMESYRSHRKSLTHWIGEPEFKRLTVENSKNILNMKKETDPQSPRGSPRESPRGRFIKGLSNPLNIPKDKDPQSKSADSFFDNQQSKGEPKLERRTSFFGKILSIMTRK